MFYFSGLRRIVEANTPQNLHPEIPARKIFAPAIQQGCVAWYSRRDMQDSTHPEIRTPP